MKKLYMLLFLVTYCSAVFSQTSECDSLTAPCINTFSGKSYYFNMEAVTDVNIERFSVMSQNCGTRDISIYYREGTYAGHEATPVDWLFGGNVTGFNPACANSCPIPETIIPILLDVCIPAGQTFGFYIATTAGTGTIEGQPDSLEGVIIAEDSHLKIFAGKASLSNGIFDQSVSSGRSWQGSVQYDCSCIVSAEQHGLNTRFSTSVHPNPASENLSYTITNNNVQLLLEIKVIDVTGKVVQAYKKEVVAGKNDFTFDLSSLAGGLYFIAVSDDEGIKVVDKFVKK